MSHTNESSQKLASSMRDLVESAEIRKVELEVGGMRILLSRGRTLDAALPAMGEPPEYPDVPTNLTDDKDSWLK